MLAIYSVFFIGLIVMELTYGRIKYNIFLSNIDSKFTIINSLKNKITKYKIITVYFVFYMHVYSMHSFKNIFMIQKL